jgi:hypothetical protein
MAARMQLGAMQRVDLANETKGTKRLYGPAHVIKEIIA